MTATVYLNGVFVSESQAAVSVFDGGWLHGAGLFETLRAEGGRVFRPGAHVDRLRRSAAQLLAPLDRAEVPSAEVCKELLERNRLASARVRWTVSAGSLRVGNSDEARRLTVCATASPLNSYGPEHYERGIQVAVCDFRVSTSDPIAGHKTTSYLPRLLGLRFAQEKRCPEALWFNTRNQLAEGSISNVFVVRDGVLKTPPLDTPVVPGTARAVVLERAAAAGIPTEQTSLTVDDLLDAHEVFLTNAIMMVMPVIRVERHDIADGRVGSVTQRLLDDYRQLVREECSPS